MNRVEICEKRWMCVVCVGGWMGVVKLKKDDLGYNGITEIPSFFLFVCLLILNANLDKML